LFIHKTSFNKFSKEVLFLKFFTCYYSNLVRFAQKITRLFWSRGDAEMGIGLRAWGTYFPERIETAAEIAAVSGVPEDVIANKMGVKQKHLAGDEDHCAQMAARAGQQSLERAELSPKEIDLIIYHGSEYKEHFVWSAATRVQQLLGAENAGAFEIYALCAGAPIAIKTARAMMNDDDSINNVLLVTASRENDLVSYHNVRARFMYNFGAGGGAMLLQRGYEHNQILSSAVLSDGSLSTTVVMQGGGSRCPTLAGSINPDLYQLDVTDLEFMGQRLGEVSMPNFKRVIQKAVEQSGYQLSDIGFLGMVHMKRSFYDALLAEFNLSQNQSVYLDEYGHMQSVDQVVALELGQQAGLLKEGQLVVLAGAGTGYTWSASAIRWG
jgi:3-oxoacyl-[acyl-carrier-protein] synthase-3